MSSPSPSEPNLTFQWPADSGFPFLLFFCVLGSLFAHVATFFLFRVVYSEHVTIPQPAPHVSLLTPSTPENAALLRWIDSVDPALVATSEPSRPPGLAEVHYVPSFTSAHTAPLGAPAEKSPEVHFPPAVDHLKAASQFPAEAAVPPLASMAPTIWHFPKILTARPVRQSAPMDFSHRATAPVEPTILLLGVNADGEVRFSMVQQTSGDASLDDVALNYLRKMVFEPADTPMTWAFITCVWGSDAYVKGNSRAE